MNQDSAVEDLVGKRVVDDGTGDYTESELCSYLTRMGFKQQRVIFPDSCITCDFHPDRANVVLNKETYAVERVFFG